MAKHKKGKKPAEKPPEQQPQQQKVCKLEAHAHNAECSPQSWRKTSCTKPVHDHVLDPCVYE